MLHPLHWSRSAVLPFLAALAAMAPAQEENAEKPEPAKPVFTDGQAQVVKAFSNPREWIHEDLWVETTFDTDGDGRPDRMHVDVTRPKQTDSDGLKVPVIYETSPYFAGVGQDQAHNCWAQHQALGAEPDPHTSMQVRLFPRKPHYIEPDPSQPMERIWVVRGFAVVHSESPGTGLSQGCPTCGGENEKLAPKAVIDWLNGRAKGFKTADGGEQVFAKWCTGKVGMTGTSYNGTLPIAAATTGVEGLEVIIPISPNTSYYHYYRSNGLVRHPGGYMGEDIDVLYDFINSGNPDHREYCNEHIRDKELKAHEDRVTGDLNAFWAGRDYVQQMGKWKAATLIAHGLTDWNVMPEHSVRVFVALKKMGVPCTLFLHRGGHGGPPPMPMMNRWFTHYLYGVDNGVEKDQHAWVVREGDRMDHPTPYDDYPLPGSAMVTLHLAGDGSAVGQLGLAAAKDARPEKLVDDGSVKGAQLAQADKSEHRLLFATPELQDAVHISGAPKVTIRLASSKPAANLSVWLVQLPWPEGRRANGVLTRGWADPQNAKSLTQSKPLMPGEFVQFSFELQPEDQIVPKGSRIAVMVFSTDQDFTLWPEAGTELTVDLDKTVLELPVVGGMDAVQRATAKTEKAEKK